MYSGSVVKTCISRGQNSSQLTAGLKMAYSILEQNLDAHSVAVLLSPVKEHFP